MMVKGIENRNTMQTSPLLHPDCVPPSHLSIPFSLSLFHPHLSAQKVSKCQMGVVIIFNGVIFLHRHTVYLCVDVCVCVCEEVEGNTIEQNEIEQGIENGKLLFSTKGGHTQTHTHAQRLEIELRMYSIFVILHSSFYVFPFYFPFSLSPSLSVHY